MQRGQKVAGSKKVTLTLGPGVLACAVAGIVGAAAGRSASRGATCALAAGLGWLAGVWSALAAVAATAARAGHDDHPSGGEVMSHPECAWSAEPGDAISQTRQALDHWRSGECKVAERLTRPVHT